jgi:hypothetical protein
MISSQGTTPQRDDNATTDIRTQQREVRQPAAQQRKQRHQRSAQLLH